MWPAGNCWGNCWDPHLWCRFDMGAGTYSSSLRLAAAALWLRHRRGSCVTRKAAPQCEQSLLLQPAGRRLQRAAVAQGAAALTGNLRLVRERLQRRGHLHPRLLPLPAGALWH